LKIDTESSLRSVTAKFRSRFRGMERIAGGYDALAALSPAELDALWNRAKRAEGLQHPTAESTSTSPLELNS